MFLMVGKKNIYLNAPKLEKINKRFNEFENIYIELWSSFIKMWNNAEDF